MLLCRTFFIVLEDEKVILAEAQGTFMALTLDALDVIMRDYPTYNTSSTKKAICNLLHPAYKLQMATSRPQSYRPPSGG